MVLNGGQRTSMTSRDGSFAFQDVPPGVYLLEVLSTTFHYSAVKIKVDDTTGIIAIEYKVYDPLVQHYSTLQYPPRLNVKPLFI